MLEQGTLAGHLTERGRTRTGQQQQHKHWSWLGVLASHVIEKVVDVGEEVIVGEVVVGVRGVRDEQVSSRTERSPKTLSPFSHTGRKELRFRRPTIPTRGARRKPGCGRSWQ